MEIAQLVLEYIKVLVWPIIAIAIVLLFRKQLNVILLRLQKADLPGGLSINFREEIEEAKQLSKKVETAPPPEKSRGVPTIPLTEANARMIAVGLQPSPSGLDLSYYRDLVAQDPNLALAGVRIEVDVLARNLAKGFGIKIDSRDSGAMLLRKLYDSGAISTDQMRLTQKVLQLANAAIHGRTVSSEEAEEVLAVASVLVDDYLSWLSWGFGGDWEPGIRNLSGADDR